MLELISDYIGVIVTTLTGILFVRFILKEKCRKNIFHILLVIMFNAFLIELLYALNIGMFRSILGYFLYLLLFRVIFKFDFMKSALVSLMFYVLLFTSEIFVFFIVTFVFKGTILFIKTTVAGNIWSNALVSIILILVSFPIRFWLIKISNIKVKIGILLCWFLSFICTILFFFLMFKTNTFNIGTYVALGIIFVMLVMIFDLFVQVYKNEQLTVKYDKMLEFIKKYEIEIENQRTYRHETKNQLLTIKSKIIDNDKNDNIIKYIDEIIKDNNVVVNHSEYAKLRYLPSNGIKGLFYFKVSEAAEKGINIDINISKCIEDSFIKSLNSVMFNQLGKVLGIFLDNAIEGAVETFSKNIGIEIYCDDGDICFIISNAYEKIVNNNGYFSLSTKGVGRGHGLILAKRIIDGNNRFINYTEVTDKLYIQKLIIKK